MALIVLSIHLVVCIALIGLVLLQRSEGGALGVGGGSGALMSGRGAADALARMTSFAGGLFLATSLGLTFISGAARDANGRSVLDMLPRFEQPAAPAPAPVQDPATTPADPTQSSAPDVAETQLASVTVPATPVQAAPAVTIAPPPAAAGERAGPISSPPAVRRATTPAPAATTPRPAATTPVVTPASATRPPATTPSTTQPAVTRPATTTPAQRPAATTPSASTPISQARPPATLQLPGGQRAADALTQPGAAANPESVDPNAAVAAVRRDRAGPDQ